MLLFGVPVIVSWQHRGVLTETTLLPSGAQVGFAGRPWGTPAVEEASPWALLYTVLPKVSAGAWRVPRL